MPNKYVLFAFAIGASMGAGFALLFAPQSGADTRKKIGEGAAGAGDYLTDTAAYLKEQAEKLSKDVQSYAEKAGVNVNQVVGQAGDVVAGALKSAQKLV